MSANLKASRSISFKIVNESKLQNYANSWPFLTWQPQIPLTCFASSARARELTNGHFSANLEHAAI